MIKRHYLLLAGYKAYSDLKAEASRGFLGVTWWVIEPILYMGVFYFAFGMMFSRGEGDYVSFLLCGLVAWKWFAGSVATGCSSIIAHRGIIRLVYVPKYVFPLASMLSGTAKFIVVFVLLIAYLLYVGYVPNRSWLWLPALLLLQFFLALGVSGILASLTPFFPDLRGLTESALMLLFFLSGIFFDIEKIDGEAASWLFLNPLASLINAYRSILIEEAFDASVLLYPALISAALLVLSILLLVRFDRQYSKVIQ